MPNVILQPVVLRAGIIKRIHMNGAVIRLNKEHLRTMGRAYREQSAITVQCTDGNFYCQGFDASGPLRARQNTRDGLDSGAVAWLETTSEMTLYPSDPGAV